jgi:hypothetical protein
MKKVLGILRVAPLRPAMAVRVKSSAWVKGKPRLSIWTVMIPQYNQTANPHSRLGMDIQRFLLATALPVLSQNFSSSTSHLLIFAVIVSLPL